MLVGDLVYNLDFELNSNYYVYDCTDATKSESWRDAACVYNSEIDGWGEPPDEVFSMEICYLTITDNILRIEAKKEK